MSLIKRLRTLTGLTQSGLADLAATSQPTIAAYETGSKKPSWRTLERLAQATGNSAVVDFVPELTREDRRSLILHRAIAAKLIDSPSDVLTLATENLRRALELHPGAADLFDEWKKILELKPETIVALMTHPGQRARELRQVTPFAGVLTVAERASVYSEFRKHEKAA